MHDIGKIGMDEEMLNYSYKLKDFELKEMKRHL